jgi:predicted amidohydrolase YtcJ
MCGPAPILASGPRFNRRAFLKWSSALAATAAVAGAPMLARPAAAQASTADLVVKGGTILTSNPLQPRAEMLAVTGGRVVAAGSAAEVAQLIGANTTVIDVQGATVSPGFVDSHMHVKLLAYDLPNVDLLQSRSIADLLAAVKARVDITPPGEWVIGRALWHQGTLAEGRLPTRADLDLVSPDNPVFLPRGGHVGVANGAALDRFGITRDTPDPQSGVIVRDGEGEPTGVLYDGARYAPYVVSALPPLPRGDAARALLVQQMAVCNALGITSATDPGIVSDDVNAYLAARRADQSTLRVHMLLQAYSVNDVREAISMYRPLAGDAMLRFGGFKYLPDGGVEGAFLKDAYQIVPGEQTRPEYHGGVHLPPGGVDEWRQMYLEAARAGFQYQTHTVGDAAIEEVLALHADVAQQVPLESLRWQVLHLFLPSADNLATMTRLGLQTSIQNVPALQGSAMDAYWGEERANRAVPTRSILDAGIVSGAGCDAPAAPESALASVQWLVTRECLDGKVRGADQAITAEEALRMYTLDSARTQFWENEIGSLEPGKLADLVVLDGDPLTVDPSHIGSINVLATLLGGRAVYDSSSMFAEQSLRDP